jgi:hypothetical protein
MLPSGIPFALFAYARFPRFGPSRLQFHRFFILLLEPEQMLVPQAVQVLGYSLFRLGLVHDVPTAPTVLLRAHVHIQA